MTGRVASTRGRRPSGSNTRAAILAAAKHQFAELGYPRTTLRAIAREAGVDPRLVTHYFGTKQQLFISVVELPFEPAAVLESVLHDGPDEVGHRLAGFALTMLETPAARQTMTGLLRAAASEDEAALLVRDLLTDRILTPLARRIGGLSEYQVEVYRGAGAAARLRLLVEPARGADPAGLVREVRDAIQLHLNFRPDVAAAAAGSLPRFELKADRFVYREERSS